jgi:hypothetical protein
MLRLLIGDSLTNVKPYSNHRVKGRPTRFSDRAFFKVSRRPQAVKRQ